ncbi:MAG: hypothetical protein E4H37_02925 [Gemmatimonadales bacterium]|nr:MAG: hypothetical protein E4H37_02925 [Gemmatimonadales bacterium]
MAFLASYLLMATSERKPGCIVIEGLGLIPCGGLVAVLASTGNELAAVRIVRLVTRRTRCSEAEQRPSQGGMLALEGAHVGSGDEGLRMAIPAARLSMTAIERVARFGVIECGRIEPDFLKIDSEVIFVALSAILIRYRCVIALLLPNSIPERRMAGQALLVCDAALSEIVTLGALANALEILMGRRELARCDHLGGERSPLTTHPEGASDEKHHQSVSAVHPWRVTPLQIAVTQDEEPLIRWSDSAARLANAGSLVCCCTFRHQLRAEE